jgi:hypothetical protein
MQPLIKIYLFTVMADNIRRPSKLLLFKLRGYLYRLKLELRLLNDHGYPYQNNICYLESQPIVIMIYMIRYLLIVFALFSARIADAQQSLTFSEYNGKESCKAITDGQIDYMFRLYNQSIDNSNEMINGREYFPYYYRSEVNPLLFNNKKKSGSLLMNGKKYNNLSLEYDTYLDVLIYCDYGKFYDNKSLMIALNSEQVQGFNLYFDNDSLIFRYLMSDKKMNFNLPEGFYEVVYDGLSKYIIKHQSAITKEKSLDVYLYSTVPYVMVGEKLLRLRSKRGFIKLFGVKSDEIRKFMRSNDVQIRSAEKNKIASVLKYYDTLLISERKSE